jgi:hypothetical protein
MRNVRVFLLLVAVSGCERQPREGKRMTSRKSEQRFEARAWLRGNRHPAAVASNRFETTAAAAEFVYRLYAGGATTVYVTDARDETAEAGGGYTDTLIVSLPAAGVERKKLFAIAAAEAEHQGYTAERDTGQQELLLWWD